MIKFMIEWEKKLKKKVYSYYICLYYFGSWRVKGLMTLSIAVPSPNLKSVVSVAISDAVEDKFLGTIHK